MNKLQSILLVILSVVLVSTSIVYASDLPSGFDEPCPNGMSIIQEVCVAVNALHDRIEVNEVDILVLQNNATALRNALLIEIAATNIDIDLFNNRTLALEAVTFQTYSQGYISLKFTNAEYELTCPEGTQLTGGGHSNIVSPNIVINSHPQNNG